MTAWFDGYVHANGIDIHYYHSGGNNKPPIVLLHGFTGLAVTVGCIVTLFVVMQMTARLRWSELFRGRAEPQAG